MAPGAPAEGPPKPAIDHRHMRPRPPTALNWSVSEVPAAAPSLGHGGWTQAGVAEREPGSLGLMRAEGGAWVLVGRVLGVPILETEEAELGRPGGCRGRVCTRPGVGDTEAQPATSSPRPSQASRCLCPLGGTRDPGPATQGRHSGPARWCPLCLIGGYGSMASGNKGWGTAAPGLQVLRV